MVRREASVVGLVISGDFSCPFSALASDRAARLEATGRAVLTGLADYLEHGGARYARDRSVNPQGMVG